MRVVGVLAVAAAIGGRGVIRAQSADWTEPFPPFKIAGNLYYVGSKGLASYLVATPQGHILINSNLETSPPLIRTSVEKLGFKFTDIKILLISHAHWDHNAGSAAIVRPTNAKYMVMDADVPVVESGGLKDFQYANDPAAHIRRIRSIASCMTATTSGWETRCSSRTSRPATRGAAPRGR